jgi:hypothetical protein
VVYDVFSFEDQLLTIDLEWGRSCLRPLKVYIQNERDFATLMNFFRTKVRILGSHSVLGDTVILDYKDLERMNSRDFPFSDELLISEFLQFHQDVRF